MERTKQILYNASGEAYSHSMLAIMGASGSGKTTLLGALSGMPSSQMKVKGKVRLNGKPVSMAAISAYVEQSDLFIPTITVKEHLYFNGRLVYGREYTDDDVRKRVNELLIEFKLEKCQNTQIGVPEEQTGISGGERRRLSIASQVITDPKIIFLDEPTSGLDSFTAENVVNALKKMAQNNCAIISTIHQPSSKIFSSFDRLILCSEGRIIYCGPTADSTAFFAKAGFVCPINYNPCDFFIEVIAHKPDKEEECNEITEKLTQLNLRQNPVKVLRFESPQSDRNDASCSHVQTAKKNALEPKLAHSLRIGFKTVDSRLQFWTLVNRSWKSSIRASLLFKARIVQTIVIGLILGLIYLRISYDYDNISNFAGAIFAIIAQHTFSSAMGVLYVLPSEFQVFRREHRKGLYWTSMYFFAKMLVELPMFMLFPTLFLLIVYFMIGFKLSWETFGIFWMVSVLVTQCAIAYGYFISSFSKDHRIALSISGPILTTLMLFGGFFLRTVNIPVYFVWISYISWFRYSFEAMCHAQFEGTQLVCRKDNLMCPPNATHVNGSVALEILGQSNNGPLLNLLCLFVLVIGYRTLSLLVIIIRTYLNER